jgi:uncharacterized protein YuzE
MKQRYLEVTFRKGKALAAYLYLPRADGARVTRTVDSGHGLHVDLDKAGKALGVEISAPSSVTVEELNAVLSAHGIGPLDPAEWAPLAA